MQDVQSAALSNVRPRKSVLSLALFLVLVLGGGIALGSITVQDGWYANLAKPPFNPPGWVFGPAWTLLYIFIAVAGWRIHHEMRAAGARKLWWVQLVLNFLWTPVFFGAHQIGVALVVILLMLAAIVAFIASARRHDRLSAWLFVPYAAWTSFATVLNASIWMLN
jgi:translocator protein